MTRSRSRVVFVCQQCGKESPKWLGRCPNCQEWNTFVETVVNLEVVSPSRFLIGSPPQELSQVPTEVTSRVLLSFSELNRVLGGGLVPGSLVLIGGDPGIGKSTFLLQVSADVADRGNKVVYVSGEESLFQVKLRAERLGIKGKGLYLLSETNLDIILRRLEELSPSLVVIDSIQTVYREDLDGAPGSITQIRECTLKLMHRAKEGDVPFFITGHVTKDGAIAGPRVLEHIVDVVLYLEGEPFSPYRLLRSVKNRFGSTNEVGVFEMRSQGLMEVENPSLAFVSQHYEAPTGAVIVSTLEGSRPLLVELQALTIPSLYGPPRRIANGVDFGRLLLITAVLTKRAGLNLANQDVIVNVTGGIKIGEPAADLGIALSIASSFRDASITPSLVVIGELGLSGEVRPVPQIERRIEEAARLGFKHYLIPRTLLPEFIARGGIHLFEVTNLKEALRLSLQKSGKKEGKAEAGIS